MEMNTIIGIVIAVVIMLVGLAMVLRKPKTVEPSLDADLHINSDSNQPVIPRNVREQLLQKDTVISTTERVEPSFKAETIQVDTQAAPVQTVAEEKAEETVKVATAPVIHTEINTSIERSEDQPQVDVSDDEDLLDKADETKVEPELSLNPNIATVEIEEFDGESNILDVHLHEQQRYDDESALATAEQIIALNVFPNPRRALSGDRKSVV